MMPKREPLARPNNLCPPFGRGHFGIVVTVFVVSISVTVAIVVRNCMWMHWLRATSTCWTEIDPRCLVAIARRAVTATVSGRIM